MNDRLPIMLLPLSLLACLTACSTSFADQRVLSESTASSESEAIEENYDFSDANLASLLREEMKIYYKAANDGTDNIYCCALDQSELRAINTASNHPVVKSLGNAIFGLVQVDDYYVVDIWKKFVPSDIEVVNGAWLPKEPARSSPAARIWVSESTFEIARIEQNK